VWQVCKLHDTTASFASSFAACYADGPAGVASRVPVRTLYAGDRVLGGAGRVTSVLVNQHRMARKSATILTLHYDGGSISLTPDHVIQVDGTFIAARGATSGKRLAVATPAGAAGLTIQRVTISTGTVVNPITTCGTLLAADPGSDAPVLAATHPEWIADFMLATPMIPLPLCRALANIFPEIAQAYYDAWLEGISAAPLQRVRSALAAPAFSALLPIFDLAAAVGFGFYSLTEHSGFTNARNGVVNDFHSLHTHGYDLSHFIGLLGAAPLVIILAHSRLQRRV